MPQNTTDLQRGNTKDKQMLNIASYPDCNANSHQSGRDNVEYFARRRRSRRTPAARPPALLVFLVEELSLNIGPELGHQVAGHTAEQAGLYTTGHDPAPNAGGRVVEIGSGDPEGQIGRAACRERVEIS